MRLFSVRHVRKVGRVGYFPIPKIVLHELGININDQIELELDTAKKILIVRPMRNRVYVPTADQQNPEMLPFTLHEKRKHDVPAGNEPAVDAEKVSA